jgi:serine/threonine protein kinase
MRLLKHNPLVVDLRQKFVEDKKDANNPKGPLKKKHIFVMDYCERGMLEDLIDKKNGYFKQLSFEMTRLIAAQLILFHSDCRKRHIVHRDLKPANVMFNRERHLEVIDFGTARKLTEINQDGKMKGTKSGTPYYMPPEMDVKREFSFTTDLWAIALIIFNCLTGTEMFASPGGLQGISTKIHNLDTKNINNLDKTSLDEE